MNLPFNPDLHNARIEWQESGEPWSSEYGDVYFSRAGGLDETRYVFLDANALPQRWLQAAAAGETLFTIAELGFGTGLNFLATWKLWQETATGQLRLHYISCEKHPLTRETLARALQQWPELADQVAALTAAYPDHTAGYHRLYLGDRETGTDLVLDLYYGDASELLAEQARYGFASVDAWYLDGFAPRVNPELWQQSLLASLHALSRPHATVSSYSVTGAVVRGLKALGFEVEKRKGFGHKREMLFAELPAEPIKTPDRPRVTIIGAGLAGGSTAWQLARRGYAPTVIDAATQAAMGASGNPQAVLQCRLNRTATAEWQFNLHGFLYASQFYDWLAAENPDFSWQDCGVLTLESAYRNTRKAGSAADYAHYPEQVLQFLDADQASAKAGITISEPALWLPDGGWLDPAALCRRYLEHPSISLQTSASVAELVRQEDVWQLLDAEGRLLQESEIVILANSYLAGQLLPAEELPIRPLRGQISTVPETADSAQMQCVVCAERYIAPARGDQHCIGASYVKNSTDTTLSVAEQEQNLALIAASLPGLALQPPTTLSGRASVRGGSMDFMPLVGAVPNAAGWTGIYGGSQHLGEHTQPLGEMTHPGLFINAGHGSHGVATTPLCADYLAALISGEASPLPAAVAECLEPARFMRRKMHRKK